MRLKEPYGRAKRDTGNKSTTNLLSWTLTMSMDTAENVQSRFEVVPISTRVNIVKQCQTIMSIDTAENVQSRSEIVPKSNYIKHFQLRLEVDGLLKEHQDGPTLPTRGRCGIVDKDGEGDKLVTFLPRCDQVFP